MKNIVQKLALCLVTICIVYLSPIPASGQNYEAMMQQYLQQDAQLSAQMQQYQRGMIQQNMQNPQVQQMYQNHLAQGGTMSLEQFAYAYGATAGFTQDGIARWNQSERNIQQNDQAAAQRYRDNQAQNYQAQQQMHQRNAEIAHQRGNLLEGTTDYRDPSSGQQYNLPHTAQPNTYTYDPGTGQYFYRDGQGNFSRRDQNGYWYGLEEE